MPRTALTVQTPIGPYPTLPLTADSADITFTAGDVSNMNSAPFGNKSKILCIFRNTGASPYTVTITSAVDTFNRTGDITTYSLGAGETMAVLIDRTGWIQSDSSVYMAVSNASVTIALIGL